MPDLLLNKLKAIAKLIGISRDKSISRRILLRFLNESQLEKESEKNFDGSVTENIRKDFNELRDRLSKPKIKKVRKDLNRIENKKTGQIENNLLNLEQSLSKLEKHHDYDDIEYK